MHYESTDFKSRWGKAGGLWKANARQAQRATQQRAFLLRRGACRGIGGKAFRITGLTRPSLSSHMCFAASESRDDLGIRRAPLLGRGSARGQKENLGGRMKRSPEER